MFYDEDGDVQPRFKLENVCKKQGDIISVTGTDDFFPYLRIRFQGALFKFEEAINKLDKSEESEVEILPGIYFSKFQSKGLRDYLKKLFGETVYLIRNENKKDRFFIESRLEPDEGGLSPNYSYDASVPTMLDPQIVEQPDELFGGSRTGCLVLHYFTILGM